VPSTAFVSVGVYSDPISVRVASGLLTSMGVPHRISPPNMYYLAVRTYYLLVAPELAEEAKRILGTSVVSEEELGELASKNSPPDDA
jgi:hypothetical protein